MSAFDYTMSYDASLAQYNGFVSPYEKDVLSSDYGGIVTYGMATAAGCETDYSGDSKPFLASSFTVTQDTNDIGVSGECTTLSAVSASENLTVLVNTHHFRR